MLGTVILTLVGALLAGMLVLWLFGERWRLLRPSTCGCSFKCKLPDE